jgi:hypothetical protein
MTALTQNKIHIVCLISSLDQLIKISINRYKLHGSWSEVQMKPLLTY